MARAAHAIDAGQARSDVAGRAGNRGNQHAKVQASDVAARADLGLDLRRVAERRELLMADAIDAAQGAVKVARPNEPGSQYVQSSDIPPATFEMLGPDRQRVVKRLELRRADEIDAP